MDRKMMRGKPTAFVCHNLVCNLPVDTPEDLRTQLKDR